MELVAAERSMGGPGYEIGACILNFVDESTEDSNPWNKIRDLLAEATGKNYWRCASSLSTENIAFTMSVYMNMDLGRSVTAATAQDELR